MALPSKPTAFYIAQVVINDFVFRLNNNDNSNGVMIFNIFKGYLYKFPFLDDDSGVKVQDNYVHPLYKHVIAVESPTLGFIGLPFYVCAFSMFDLQVRIVTPLPPLSSHQ